MKSFVAFLCLAFLVHTLAIAVPVMDHHGQSVPDISTVPENCEYHCPDADLGVCARNGQCTQKFQSKCELSAYNCKNPQKPFVIIEDWKCEQFGAPLCGPKELSPQ